VREASEVREPDAVTPHVRIYEGPRVNAARLSYCDTARGNGWPTVNTNLNLNQRDLGLLTREHAKASQIPFVMLEDGLRAAEVRPLSILPVDADQFTDACGIFRNEWQ